MEMKKIFPQNLNTILQNNNSRYYGQVENLGIQLWNEKELNNFYPILPHNKTNLNMFLLQKLLLNLCFRL